MVSYAGKLRVFAIVSMLLASVAEPKAQAQGYDLRCRGKSGAFVFDGPQGNTYSIRFAASTRAAGPGNQGLDPGTCSWVDRPLNSAEPSEIHYQAQMWQTRLIATQLSDPSNYWSFIVVNTNRGYFDANSQNPSTKPDPAPQSNSNADITTRRTNVDVTPRRAGGTKADIIGRRPVLTPPSAPPIDKQTGVTDQAKLVQLIRDVKVEDITPRSLTLSFTTTQPATSEVRVGIWSYYFSLDGKQHWVMDQDVEYSGGPVSIVGPSMQTTHRITICLRRDMVTGERRQLLIYARTADGERFDYEYIFTTP